MHPDVACFVSVPWMNRRHPPPMLSTWYLSSALNSLNFKNNKILLLLLYNCPEVLRTKGPCSASALLPLIIPGIPGTCTGGQNAPAELRCTCWVMSRVGEMNDYFLGSQIPTARANKTYQIK